MKFFNKPNQNANSNLQREVIDKEISPDLHTAVREVKKILENKIRKECKFSKDQEIKWEPYLGTKHTEHMDNLGYVIGLRCGYYSFRVDYDPDKGIHINYGNDAKGSDYLRARIAERPANIFSANNDDESYVRQVWEELTRVYGNMSGSPEFEKCRDEIQDKLEALNIVRVF